jgi:hypothetical protein
MAEFRVVVEGLELDERATQRLNDQIQRVVLDHLADHDLTTSKPRAVVAFRPHPDWYGLIAHILDRDQVVVIPEVQRSFEQFR